MTIAVCKVCEKDIWSDKPAEGDKIALDICDECKPRQFPLNSSEGAEDITDKDWDKP